jgi:hypothetical protein
MKRSRPDRRSLPADYLQPLVTALGDPATLASVRGEELEAVAFQLALYFGVRRDPETASALGGVYERMQDERTPAERRAFVDEVTAAVRGGATSVLALLPVLQRERDAEVAREAALAFGTLLPADGGDALAGPRALRALLDHAEPDGVRAGLVGALLALGDHRLAPVLDGAWRALTPAAAESLLALPRTWASRLEVEWLLAWMEDAEPATFAAIAGSLARLATEGEGRVLELERELPASAAAAPITILRDWSARGLGEELAPRWRDLARRAGAESAFAAVFAAWGVPGQAP